MRYLVPQFVERDIKIVGPLNFTQFLYFLGGGIACLFLWALFYETHFFLFVFLCTIAIGISASLAFIKYQGVPLPELIVHFFGFSIKGRRYIWEKKAVKAEEFQIPEYIEPEEIKEVLPGKKGSSIDALSSQIEIDQ